MSYFDSVADAYAARYENRSPGGYAFRVRKEGVLRLLNGAGGRVLDVGCAPGIMVPDLRRKGREIWAVDAAPLMVEQCRLPSVTCLASIAKWAT